MTNRSMRFAFGSALVIAAPVLAADAPEERGWYVEANVATVASSGSQSPFVFDDDESGWSLAGGYAFNRHFALQAGYHDFGTHFATDCPAPICTAVPHEDRVAIEGLSIVAIGTWPVTANVELFGKLGVLGWDADFELAGGDDQDRDALVGAGVGLRLSPRWRLNVQYERVDFDLESASLGASIRF